MNTVELAVTLLGVCAIIWVNYYFFFYRRDAAAAPLPAVGPQEITVEVLGGYSPSVIQVKAGRRVRLNFHRLDTGSCTEEVVLGDFGIRRFLPSGETTPVEFTPAVPGTHEFVCGMGMVRGKVIAQ